MFMLSMFCISARISYSLVIFFKTPHSKKYFSRLFYLSCQNGVRSLRMTCFVANELETPSFCFCIFQEVAVEIAELEKQKDELEAALKKVFQALYNLGFWHVLLQETYNSQLLFLGAYHLDMLSSNIGRFWLQMQPCT